MLKVMVVDDEMLIQKRIMLGFDWQAMGYEIEDEAGDGASALELFAQKQYDLAIVDIAMPGINGINLVKKSGNCSIRPMLSFLQATATLNTRSRQSNTGSMIISSSPLMKTRSLRY